MKILLTMVACLLVSASSDALQGFVEIEPNLFTLSFGAIHSGVAIYPEQFEVLSSYMWYSDDTSTGDQSFAHRCWGVGIRCFPDKPVKGKTLFESLHLRYAETRYDSRCCGEYMDEHYALIMSWGIMSYLLKPCYTAWSFDLGFQHIIRTTSSTQMTETGLIFGFTITLGTYVH